MRFKEFSCFKSLCNIFPDLLYFSKEVEEQKSDGRGSTSVTEKCKRKLLTTVENLCNFLHLFKYIF